jgi:hypothetical protein
VHDFVLYLDGKETLVVGDKSRRRKVTPDEIPSSRRRDRNVVGEGTAALRLTDYSSSPLLLICVGCTKSVVLICLPQNALCVDKTGSTTIDANWFLLLFG